MKCKCCIIYDVRQTHIYPICTLIKKNVNGISHQTRSNAILYFQILVCTVFIAILKYKHPASLNGLAWKYHNAHV